MKIYVVGLGPGDERQITPRAMDALESSNVIAGYEGYISLIRERFADKRFIATGMTKETDRCKAALVEAAAGSTVSMVCSGDAGIYGMAGLMLELSQDYDDIQVEVIPGITAASSGGALLGAPLGHDFAVISLSDLLTPWEVIEKRLGAAAQADFAICLYNPSSHKRSGYLKKACEIVLAWREPGTVCGVARNIGREGESFMIMTLAELQNTQVDMFSTVFIGNTQTKRIGDHMVTPRGYRDV
jgi:precorrin-3B C17-methyltransferase